MYVTKFFVILALHISAHVIYLTALEKINLYSPTLLFSIPGIVGCKEYEYSTGKDWNENDVVGYVLWVALLRDSVFTENKEKNEKNNYDNSISAVDINNGTC